LPRGTLATGSVKRRWRFWRRAEDDLKMTGDNFGLSG